MLDDDKYVELGNPLFVYDSAQDGIIKVRLTNNSVLGTKNVKCGLEKFVNQNNKNLCWAASAATVINYEELLVNVTAESIADELNIAYG